MPQVAEARRFDQILNNVIIATRLISQVKKKGPHENLISAAFFKKKNQLGWWPPLKQLTGLCGSSRVAKTGVAMIVMVEH